MSSPIKATSTSVADVELPCFHAARLFVHAKIPPCDTLGHKADTWNVTNPDFRCSLMCCTKGDVFIIRLLTDPADSNDAQNGTETPPETFAEAFWNPDRPMSSIIDAAVDSSRYFALRVENPETGAHVFIGVGFADRETAGQFKLTLAEHGRFLKRMSKAESDSLSAPALSPQALAAGSPGAARTSSGSDTSLASPPKDLSLHGNIHVVLPRMGEKRGLMAKQSGAGGGATLVAGPGGGLLPPPMPRTAQAPLQEPSGKAQGPGGAAAVPIAGVSGEFGVGGEDDDDDGFGDFCGAD